MKANVTVGGAVSVLAAGVLFGVGYALGAGAVEDARLRRKRAQRTARQEEIVSSGNIRAEREQRRHGNQ